MKSKKVVKHLHSDDRAGDVVILMNHRLEKDLHGFPGAAAEIGKKLPIVEKITAVDFWYADFPDNAAYGDPVYLWEANV